MIIQGSLRKFKMVQGLKCYLIVVIATILLFFARFNSRKGCLGFPILHERFNTVNDSEVLVVSTDCNDYSNWIYDMHLWTNAKGRRSQGGQDLYLEKIFSVIQSTNRYFVEFGFNEPAYNSGGSGANTYYLYEKGWHGLLLDGSQENVQINLKKHYLFASNIAAIFKENMVPKDLDYLSCDMDSHDLWVFRAILHAGYRPRVITTEYNSNYPITDALTVVDPTIVHGGSLPSNFAYKGTHQCSWGAGAGALRMVAEAHGYTLVGRVWVWDLVWIRNDLVINKCFRLPPFEWFFRDAPIGQLHHKALSTPQDLSQIVDYETYLLTGGNINNSNRVARDILKRRNLPCYNDVKGFL